jgi:hypothetical protein
MFDNALTLYPGDAIAGISVSVTDTDNGVTTRQYAAGGGTFTRLTISRQETNENKGLITDRYLVRVDDIIPDPVIVTGPPAVVTAYQVFALPRRTDLLPSHLAATQHKLMSFLLGRQDIDAEVLVTITQRLLNGET